MKRKARRLYALTPSYLVNGVDAFFDKTFAKTYAKSLQDINGFSYLTIVEFKEVLPRQKKEKKK